MPALTIRTKSASCSAVVCTGAEGALFELSHADSTLPRVTIRTADFKTLSVGTEELTLALRAQWDTNRNCQKRCAIEPFEFEGIFKLSSYRYLYSQPSNGLATVLEQQNTRPTQVIGPLGEPLTLERLPSTNTDHWTVRRKAEVVAAVAGGLLSFDEACGQYSLSTEEFSSWQRSVDRSGMPGLRVTRIQDYRDFYERRRLD